MLRYGYYGEGPRDDRRQGKYRTGTLYNLLDQFSQAEMIVETKVEGRRKSYILTEIGEEALRAEYERICGQAADYRRYMEVQEHEKGET